jgi:quercetin dioxygenase-like cupin family protein
MADIVFADHNEMPWTAYRPGADGGGIRFKALFLDEPDAPRIQYIEYPPGHVDPVHSHDEGAVFIVTAGELYLDDVPHGPGSVVFIPTGADYAVRAGDSEPLQYFRIVVSR